MVSKQILRPILDNESITRGLADPEARILIEWLVRQAERLDVCIGIVERVEEEVAKLCRRARAVSRFVFLWTSEQTGAANQLAAVERFCWPLPTMPVDPCELMLDILEYEVPELLQDYTSVAA